MSPTSVTPFEILSPLVLIMILWISRPPTIAGKLELRLRFATKR